MRPLRLLPIIALMLAAAPAAAQAPPAGGGGGGGGGGGPPFTLMTDAFEEGETIPIRFTQAGEGVLPGEGTSPALSWINPPAGTVSYVLHFHDLEVARMRTTEDQIHWLVWNIPVTTTSLPEGVPPGPLADGSRQISATGERYRGPGAGAAGNPHHYTFELLALDIALDIPPGEDAFATRRTIWEAIQGHVLGRTIYIGTFKRPN